MNELKSVERASAIEIDAAILLSLKQLANLVHKSELCIIDNSQLNDKSGYLNLGFSLIAVTRTLASPMHIFRIFIFR